MTPGTYSAMVVCQATGHVQMINLLLEVEIRSAPVAQLTAAHSAPAQIAGLVNLIQQSLTVTLQRLVLGLLPCFWKGGRRKRLVVILNQELECASVLFT